jgi:hypothetical protein
MKIVYDNLAANISTDKHLFCLHKYASRVRSAMIMGAKSGLSLLTVISAGVKTVHLWDPQKQDTEDFDNVCLDNQIRFHHTHGEIETPIPSVDLLYLDTFSECHLKFSELSQFAPQVGRYILIPRTYTHAHDGETGFLLPDNLQPAGVIHGINSFISQSPQWHILEHQYWAPGMTVLYKRRDVNDDGR